MMRNFSGFFYIFNISKRVKMEYQKPPLTFDQQLDLLISRGLEINDRASALAYVRNISYYRLSAYFLPFKKSDEKFRSGVDFKDVINLYAFDQKLRSLVLEAIEPIEIALRTQLIYQLSHTYGAFGYLEPDTFSERFKHTQWLEHLTQSINDSTEIFISHYRGKYIKNSHLPLWMALEVLSFGGLSRLFRGLQGTDQQVIAAQYDIRDIVLSSWFHTFVYARNLCAHHARLWNRTLTFKPKLPERLPMWQGMRNDRLYSLLAIIQYLISRINPHSNWKDRLIALLNDNSTVSLVTMGFPDDWNKRALWGT